MMKLLFLSLALVFTQTAFAHPHQHPHPDPQNASRLYLHELGFFPTGPGCFERAPQHILPGHTFEAIQSGGVAVYTSQGVRVMTGFDPLYLSFGMSRNNAKFKEFFFLLQEFKREYIYILIW